MTDSPDLITIEQTLSVSGLARPGEMAWLRESWSDPGVFWKSLKEAHDELFSLPGKSVLFTSYDFYHDIVTRNRHSAATAFRWRDGMNRWQEISYAELGDRVDRLGAFWRRRGLEPGRKLCVLYPLGIEFVVSFLAGLKLGLVLCVIEPKGRAFVQRRLNALKPDAIVMERLDVYLTGPWQGVFLKGDDGEISVSADEERSYTYASGEMVELCFDPSSNTPHLPRPLASDAAYVCPLRDGLIALNLRPGRALAAPDCHFLETQPALLLSCLINGAAYVHLKPDQIADNTQLLIDYPVDTLGISARMRDMLMDQPVALPDDLKFWFRNPAECMDIVQWQAFIDTLGLQKTLAGNLLWNASSGGCTLFSVKRRGQATQNVMPSAGVPWLLQALEGAGAEAMGETGVFTPLAVGEKKEVIPSASILAELRDEWLYVGCCGAVRSGRHYPREEVLDIVAEVEACSLCSIVDMPISGHAPRTLFLLLIFTGSRKDIDEGRVIEDIRTHVKQEMGEEFLPDRILFFPLYPRIDSSEEIDHEWCRVQHLTGQLFRKSKEELYGCLTRLHEVCEN